MTEEKKNPEELTKSVETNVADEEKPGEKADEKSSATLEKSETKKTVPVKSDRKRPTGRRQFEDKGVDKYWTPTTKLGNLVRNGVITNMEDALNSGLVLREPEIVDILLGELEDEVIDVNMVQRMTDSGRRVRFAVTVAVGNGNGYLGLGRVHGKEVGPTIRKAIDNAKLNIISLKRGCGSWECGCGTPHSIPYKTFGKAGSVEVTFIPAPKGVGLAAGEVAKKILKLGGVKDMWATTKGQTQTTVNYAKAVYDALINLSTMRINNRQMEKFKILTGGVEE